MKNKFTADFKPPRENGLHSFCFSNKPATRSFSFKLVGLSGGMMDGSLPAVTELQGAEIILHQPLRNWIEISSQRGQIPKQKHTRKKQKV